MHSKPKLSMFGALSQNHRNCFENWYTNILKQIVCKTQIRNWNFSRPSGSRVIDWNNILHVLINNSKSMWPTKILTQFLSLELWQFASRCINFYTHKKNNWNSAQNMAQLWFGVHFPLNFKPILRINLMLMHCLCLIWVKCALYFRLYAKCAIPKI